MTKLNNIEKMNPFKVPDNYFNELSDKIQSRVSNQKSETKSIPFKSYFLRPSIAAAIILLLISGILIKVFVFDNLSSNKSQFSENSIIENYIDEKTIVNEIAEDSLIPESAIQSAKSDVEDDDAEVVAEHIDYQTLLAEL